MILQAIAQPALTIPWFYQSMILTLVIKQKVHQENNAHEIYKEWSNCQSKDTVKMMAIVLMDTFWCDQCC